MRKKKQRKTEEIHNSDTAAKPSNRQNNNNNSKMDIKPNVTEPTITAQSKHEKWLLTFSVEILNYFTIDTNFSSHHLRSYNSASSLGIHIDVLPLIEVQ